MGELLGVADVFDRGGEFVDEMTGGTEAYRRART
jgi:hypothetical protein